MSKKMKIVLIIMIILILINVFLLINKKDDNTVIKNNQTIENYEKNKTNLDIKGNNNIKLQSDGTIINNSNELKEKKQIAGLIIEDIKVLYINNQTEIRGIIKNQMSNEINVTFVNANIIDENGEIFRTVRVYIGKINANSTKQLNITIQSDVSNMKDIEFVQ